MPQGNAQSIDSVNAKLKFTSNAQAIDSVNADFEILSEGFRLLTPATGEINVTLQPTFSWQDPENRGLYRLVYSLNQDYSNSTKIWTTGTSYTPPSNLTSGTYYWKVEAQTLIDRPPIVSQLGEGSEALDTQWANDLYAATDGDNWFINTGWNSGDVTLQVSGYEEAPYGLRCEEINGEIRITGVDLFYNNLINGVQTGTEGTIPVKEVIAGRELPDTFDNLQYCRDLNLKGNEIGGRVPSSISRMTRAERIILQGRYYGSSVGDQGTPNDPGRYRWPEINGENHPGKARHKDENFFGEELPQDWSACQDLKDIQIDSNYDKSTDQITGSFPDSIMALPNIRIVLFYRVYFQNGTVPDNVVSPDLNVIQLGGHPDGTFGGPMPDSWGDRHLSQMRTSSVKWTGDFPLSWEGHTDMKHLLIHDSETANLRFPVWLFTGSSPSLIYLTLSNVGMQGTIPTEVNGIPIDPLDTNLYILKLTQNQLTGEIPNWIAGISVVQFNLHQNNFTSLGSEFYNQDAMIYNQLRLFMVFDNDITDELPDVCFSRVYKSGLVVDSNTTVLDVDFNLGVVASGTITNAADTWIRDINSSWSNSWINHEVTIIVPDGEDIVFIPNVSYNYEVGYLYSESQADVSGTEGLSYEIRPLAVNKVVRIKRGENDYIARYVTANTDNSITLNKPLFEDVINSEVSLHLESDLLFLYVQRNNFFGKIPESYGYVPTYRPLKITLSNNNLSETVPSFEFIGINNGGSSESNNITDNNFLFADLLENYTENQALGGFSLGNQKRFGTTQIINTDIGSTEIISFNQLTHPDNVYQWKKNGVNISGETDKSITISIDTEDDFDIYELEVTNTTLTGITLISNIVQISEQTDQQP